MTTKSAIRATATSLKTFLGVEASAATALEASIKHARRHRMHEHTLEKALEDVGGLDVCSNEQFVWIAKTPGELTLYVDLKTDEYYIGAV